MVEKVTGLRTRLYLCSIAVLALGLCAALGVYLTAGDAPPDAMGYVIVDGTAYPTAGTRSKTYVRELERFGGKATVLFDEIDRWFAGLWQGRSLAITIAWISVAASLGLFLFACWLPPDAHSGTKSDGNRPGESA